VFGRCVGLKEGVRVGCSIEEGAVESKERAGY
jgi:hypothetical protein